MCIKLRTISMIKLPSTTKQIRKFPIVLPLLILLKDQSHQANEAMTLNGSSLQNIRMICCSSEAWLTLLQ